MARSPLDPCWPPGNTEPSSTSPRPASSSVGTDKEKLRQCFAGWKGKMFGVPGEAYFDKTGQLIQESVLVEVGGGAFQAFKGK